MLGLGFKQSSFLWTFWKMTPRHKHSTLNWQQPCYLARFSVTPSHWRIVVICNKATSHRILSFPTSCLSDHHHNTWWWGAKSGIQTRDLLNATLALATAICPSRSDPPKLWQISKKREIKTRHLGDPLGGNAERPTAANQPPSGSFETFRGRAFVSRHIKGQEEPRTRKVF